MFRSFIVLIVSIVLSGCGTSRYVLNQANVNEPTCKVFVFRDKFTLLWSFNIDVNGVNYAKLKDETYISFNLPKGEHVIEANWAILSGGIDLKTSVTCEPESSIYLAFKGQGNFDGRYLRRKIEAVLISEEAAQNRIKNYALVE
jgi:hypothetical protein